MEGLRGADVAELAEASATVDVSLHVRVLDAIADLPLEPDAVDVLFRTVSADLESVEPGTVERRNLLDIACRLPLPEARTIVQAVAHDPNDPDSWSAIESLIAAHDVDAIGPAIERYVSKGALDDLEALASLPLEISDTEPSLFDDALEASDPLTRFVAAVAVGRLGVTRPLARALAGIDDVSMLADGDPSMAYAALARLRPLPIRLQAWLAERLDDLSLSDRGRVAVWALTGMANWEGIPVPTGREVEEPTVRPVTEADLAPDLVGIFEQAPKDDAGRLFLVVHDYAADLDMLDDPWRRLNFSNSVVRVAEAVPYDAVPVRELVANAVEDHTVLDRGQVGWVLARAGPQRLLQEVKPYLRGDISADHVPVVADFVKAAGEQFAYPSTPYRGGVPAPVMAAPMAPPLLPPSGPRVAWPRVDAPASVHPSDVFDVTVGLAEQPQADVAGPPISLPTYEVDITLVFVFEGLELADGGPGVDVLHVREADPWPAVTIQLRALDDPSFGDTRRIVVLYLIDHDVRGIAERTVAVTAGMAPTGEPVEPPEAVALDRDRAVAPVVTIVAWPVAGSDRELQWIVVAEGVPMRPVEQSAMRKVAPNRAPLANKVTNLGEADMTSLARFLALYGIGEEIAMAVPGPVVDALRTAATATAPAPPEILLLTHDGYVPWELAVFDPPVVPTSPSPFLGGQALVGRWVLSPAVSSPCVTVPVTTQALVTGDYSGLSQWEPLDAATKEASDLADKWAGSVSVNATFNDVIALLEGAPDADVLHFSLHGKSTIEEVVQQGLVLVEETLVEGEPKKRAAFLMPEQVRGRRLRKRPFVFLNACQVAKGSELLGDYAGLAAAFLKAGAAGVVAPLWKVDDALAAEVALGFYDAAFGASGPPVRAAAAVRAQRERFTREASATDSEGRSGTYLAYQFFGHPSLLLVKGQADGA